MSRAEGIRKLGFRRWYERQLIESHAYFVTWFLALILLCACLEGISLRAPGVRGALLLALLLATLLLGLAALRRYASLLQRAERSRSQSTCSRCSTYGRFQVLDPGAENGASRSVAASGDEAAEPRLRVRCNQCGHEWMIE